MMPATDAADRRAQRQATRRRLILDAAAEEFAAVGYDAATLARIGDRVGLTKAALYHYVDGKQQLLAALFSDAADEIAERAATAVGPDATPTERLAAFARAHVEVAVTSAGGQVLKENLDALLTTDATRAARRRHEELLAVIVRDGIASGDFRPVSVPATTKLLFGALNTVPRWFDADRDDPLEAVLDEAVRFVLHAVGAEPG